MRRRPGIPALLLGAVVLGLSACNPVQPPPPCEGVECCPMGVDPVLGTAAGEVLRGTSGADCILGEGGDDTILSRDGADVALGGPDADVLSGGTGPKFYQGNGGPDRLVGNADADHLHGGEGDDQLDGRGGDDTLLCGEGDDQAIGGSGDDEIDCGPGADVLLGEDGDDDLRGGEGDDRLFGGPDDDLLIGGPGRDEIEGGGGNDTIRIDEACEASPGDRVTGGTGFDVVRSPLTQPQLEELGFLFEEIEQFVEIPVPPDAACQLPPPRPVGEGGLCSLMQESAALVEGTVADISETFDAQEGPREVVTLANVVVHLGSTGLPLGGTLRLRTLRGAVPTILHPMTNEPARLEVTHTPVFHEGERYLIPLRGTYWNDSPVAWPYYYRVAELDGTPILVDAAGYALSRVYGARLRTQLFAPLASGEDVEQIAEPAAGELGGAISPAAFVEGWQSIRSNCEGAFTGKFSPFPDQRRQWDRTGVASEGGGGILPPCLPGAIDPETGEESACEE